MIIQGYSYVRANMLENWLMPQLNEDSNDYIFQQDGSPAHYKEVRRYLNRNLPLKVDRTHRKRWRVNAVATPVTGFNPVWLFLLGGFVKDTVFVPPLPANLQIFATVITAAVALVDRDMVTRVWNEMDYRIDVCRITKGGQIEHLWNV